MAVRRRLGDRPYAVEERNQLALFHEEVVRLDTTAHPHREAPRLTAREELAHCLRR